MSTSSGLPSDRQFLLAPTAIDGKLNELFEHAEGASIPLYVLIDEYDSLRQHLAHVPQNSA